MNHFEKDFLHARKLDFVNSFQTMLCNVGTPESPIWTAGEVLKQEVMEDGRMRFLVAFIETTESACSACQFRIIDKDGLIAAQFDQNVQTAYGQGIYASVVISMDELNWEVE